LQVAIHRNGTAMAKLRKRVLVAMSGGVDSSVAAYLLKKDGFDVTGVTMRFGAAGVNTGESARQNLRAVRDARKVCLRLGIRHRVMDFSEELEKRVIERFVLEYANGRTPNPCVDCNKILKFGILLEKALRLGFDFLATGHYADIDPRVYGGRNSGQNKGRNRITGKKRKIYRLKKSKDERKDQSYFLYAIKKESLKSILFPLGRLTKSRVREIAKSAGLPVADKPESLDVCFIPRGNFRGFLSKRIGAFRGGPVLNLRGDVIGGHRGAFFYTIGQRGGLGIGYKYPLYVLAVDTVKNQVVVGKKENLKARTLVAGNINKLVDRFPRKAFAKIRYAHKEAKCSIFRDKDKFRVIFDKPQEAITPGQSIVFYSGDTVLGGGIIEKTTGGVKWP